MPTLRTHHQPAGEPKRSPVSGILIRPPSRRLSGIAPAPQADPGQRPSELAHDARNLISALQLFSELLACPGVLAPGFSHYADDLRRVAGSGARLIEALASSTSSPAKALAIPLRRPVPGIEDLGTELAALERPLRALAGSGVLLEVEFAPCAGRLALNSEDLLRILLNLVANAVEALAALPPGRHSRPYIRITAQRGAGDSFLPYSCDRNSDTVVLSVRDNGPGIAAVDLPKIFDPGFSKHPPCVPQTADLIPLCKHSGTRGTGLSIVRQLVEAAGGAVRAVSSRGLGARFDIELPLVSAAPKARIDFVNPGCQSHSKNLQQSSAQTEKEA